MLLVVLFHAAVPGFGGGYVGVDVFFVISGYLITGLLLRQLRTTGRLGLKAFYARRARRLLPMATVVITVVVIASSLLLAPLVVPTIAHDGIACALFFANIRFAAQATNYFGAHLGPNPLLHFWSLSLEEQYYLVWPSLLLLIGGRAVRQRSLVLGLSAIFTTSLALSIVLTQSSRPWAFFSMPSRAWEFAVGGLLAIVPTAALPVAVRRGVALGGLVLVLGAATLYSANAAFPGWIALVPVGGGAALIVGGTTVGPLLSAGPLPWLGRRSYGLYLWHYPMLVLTPIAIGHALDLGARLLVCCAAVALSAVTYRCIENPARSSAWLIRRPRRGLVAGASLVAATTVVSGLVLVTAPPLQGLGAAVTSSSPTSAAELQHDLAAGLTTRAVPRNLTPSLPSVADDGPSYVADGCNDDYPNTGLPGPQCVYGDRHAHAVVVLLGDSHAGQWFPALDLLAQRQHFALVPLTKFSCPVPQVSFFVPMLGHTYEECDLFRQRAIARIRQLKPDLVIVSSSKGYGAVANPAPWERGYRATLQAIRASARSIVVLGDTPYWPADPSSCVSANLGDVRACVQPLAEAEDAPHAGAEERAARAVGARYVDPLPWLCTPQGCPLIVGNLLVYRNTNHITPPFAVWLSRVLEQAIQAPHG